VQLTFRSDLPGIHTKRTWATDRYSGRSDTKEILEMRGNGSNGPVIRLKTLNGIDGSGNVHTQEQQDEGMWDRKHG
jgi:hypothetical protein